MKTVTSHINQDHVHWCQWGYSNIHPLIESRIWPLVTSPLIMQSHQHPTSIISLWLPHSFGYNKVASALVGDTNTMNLRWLLQYSYFKTAHLLSNPKAQSSSAPVTCPKQKPCFAFPSCSRAKGVSPGRLALRLLKDSSSDLQTEQKILGFSTAQGELCFG